MNTKKLIVEVTSTLLNFFRAEAERRFQNGDNTGVIYAIEEPETSQHTANQRILIQALKILANSPHTQVILTTHSGIIVKELDFSNLRLVSDVDNQKQVLNVEPGVLQYPSLNEVNFSAFGEVTEEYHNELYGFLHLQGWLPGYKQGRQLFPYDREDRNGVVYTQQLVRTEIIRHQIQQPENTHNTRFTRGELQISIDDMRQYIRTRAEAEGMWDPIDDYKLLIREHHNENLPHHRLCRFYRIKLRLLYAEQIPGHPPFQFR